MNKVQRNILKDIIIRERICFHNRDDYKMIKEGAHEFESLYYMYTDGAIGLFLKGPVPNGINEGTKTNGHYLLEKMTEIAAKYVQKPSHRFELDIPLTLEKCKRAVEQWVRGADITESEAPTLQFSATWKDQTVDACYNADFLECLLTLLPPDKTKFFVTSEPFNRDRANVLVGIPKGGKDFAPCGFLLPTKPDKFTKNLSCI